MLLFETTKSYIHNLTGLPPYRLLAPVTYKTIFKIRYIGAVVNQGKQFVLYVVLWIYCIAKIDHGGNHSVWLLLLVVRQWTLQPLVTMSFGISHLFGKASVPKARVMGYDVTKHRNGLQPTG